uniref:Nucleoside phosphorylase domain-containing protein n=1 Tax=Bicosoecida sp. CB-2014 TaxID=1486930 RepID=A0A7S1GAS7_9STRA
MSDDLTGTRGKRSRTQGRGVGGAGGGAAGQDGGGARRGGAGGGFSEYGGGGGGRGKRRRESHSRSDGAADDDDSDAPRSEVIGASAAVPAASAESHVSTAFTLVGGAASPSSGAHAAPATAEMEWKDPVDVRYEGARNLDEFEQLTFKAAKWTERLRPAIKFVMLVINGAERDAVINMLRKPQGFAEPVTIASKYHIGIFGSTGVLVAVVTSGPGAGGLQGCQRALTDALHDLGRHTILNVGVGFGRKPFGDDGRLFSKGAQLLGDVFVSSSVAAYDLVRATRVKVDGRWTTHYEWRGDKVPCMLAQTAAADTCTWFTQKLEEKYEWDFDETLVDRPPKATVAPFISGHMLVDDATIHKQLFSRFEDAKFGEMEGSGVLAAADCHNVHWMIIKSICDYGGQGLPKNKKAQAYAAWTACQFVEALLPGLKNHERLAASPSGCAGSSSAASSGGTGAGGAGGAGGLPRHELADSRVKAKGDVFRGTSSRTTNSQIDTEGSFGSA